MRETTDRTSALSRRRFLAASAALTAAASSRAMADAQTSNTATIRAIVFPGAGNGLPLWVAQAQGYFARESLNVTVTPTPGSVYQMTHLVAGDFDIAHTSADNVIAYSVGAAEAPVPAGTSLVAVMGGDDGFLHVLSRAPFTTFAQLRGARIGVDALTTGFAFVLRRVLERRGLNAADYSLIAVGAGAKRYAALLDGSIDATISSTPFDVMGRAAGLNDLGACAPIIGAYQGYVAVTTSAWATANTDRLTRYIRAYIAALDWLYAPENAEAALTILAENAKLSPAVAAGVYSTLTDAKNGYARKAAINLDGMNTVIALRKAYASSTSPIADASTYVNTAAYARSLSST